MKLGVLVPFNTDVENEIRKLKELGFSSCQLSSWTEELYTDKMANIINDATEKYGVSISTFWRG